MSHVNNARRASLTVQQLEDRCTPSTLGLKALPMLKHHGRPVRVQVRVMPHGPQHGMMQMQNNAGLSANLLGLLGTPATPTGQPGTAAPAGSATLQNGTVFIQGTQGTDQVAIFFAPNKRGDTVVGTAVVVSVNGQENFFPQGQVNAIVYDGNGGQVQLQNSTGIPTSSNQTVTGTTTGQAVLPTAPVAPTQITLPPNVFVPFRKF
jgi:hypothetical protein